MPEFAVTATCHWISSAVNVFAGTVTLRDSPATEISWILPESPALQRKTADACTTSGYVRDDPSASHENLLSCFFEIDPLAGVQFLIVTPTVSLSSTSTVKYGRKDPVVRIYAETSTYHCLTAAPQLSASPAEMLSSVTQPPFLTFSPLFPEKRSSTRWLLLYVIVSTSTGAARSSNTRFAAGPRLVASGSTILLTYTAILDSDVILLYCMLAGRSSNVITRQSSTSSIAGSDW